ncbi:MAG: polymorphic toxin type 46 domain-containing protein [Gammaproteobacteria bacterium]
MASDNPAVNFLEYMKGVGDSAANIAKEGAYGVYDFVQVAAGGAKIAAKEGLSAIGAEEAAAKILIEDIEPMSSLGKVAAQGGYEGLGEAVKNMPGNVAGAVTDAVQQGDMRALGSAVTDAVFMAEGARAGVVGAAKGAGKAAAKLKPALDATVDAAGKAKTALSKAQASKNPEIANQATAACDKKNDVLVRKAKNSVITNREIELAKSDGHTPNHVRARKKIATQFYEQQGMPAAKISGHLDGIDFSKPVEVTELPPGKILHQFQVPDAPQGNYYAESGAKPSDLGIADKARDWNSGKIVEKQINVYTTNSTVKVLRSTAASIKDTWSIPNETILTNGGATQYFTTSSGSFNLI